MIQTARLPRVHYCENLCGQTLGGFVDNSTWQIEIFNEGNFARFFKRLDEAERAVVDAAIQHVLVPLGIDICASEWGKSLGQGLYELRIRRNLETILREYGSPESVERFPNRWHKKRILIRIYCTFYGDRVVLLLGGYNKLRAPSQKQEQKEIKAARATLASWHRQQSY